MHREINGLLVIDKPPEMTSARLTAIVKKLLRVKKAGHTGTLDPFATGVMLLCLGKATKLARFFLHEEKTYTGIMKLGIETDTQDLTGHITATGDPMSITEKEIIRAFEKFKGTIRQAPPVFSALKHHGTPLYRLARMGKPVQKPPRTVHIHELTVLDIRLPEIEFRVNCSGGTYIRTLVSDIGKILDCGGHLTTLKRTENAGFKIEEAISLQKLEKMAEIGGGDTPQGVYNYLITMRKALKNLPEIIVDKTMAKSILDGKKIHVKSFTGMAQREKQPVGNYIKVVNSYGELLAVLNLEKNQDFYKYCCVFSI